MAIYGLPLIGIRTPAFLTVVVCLGLTTSAYIGEVFRGALDSIDRLQREAGLALGMSNRRIFWSVLMPQMWRLSIPGVINDSPPSLKPPRLPTWPESPGNSQRSADPYGGDFARAPGLHRRRSAVFAALSGLPRPFSCHIPPVSHPRF
jgi:hypothetical protein